MSRAPRVIARLFGATMLLTPALAGAQLVNASSAATGLGGAYTARAQGYNAVFWNPANLGMPGNQGFSFALLGIEGQAGIKPIDFNKISQYSGDTIPKTVREQWMLDVERDGGQKGGMGLGLTGIGLSVGPVAFQWSGSVSTDVNLAPGAVEALFFGNAGRYDTLRTLSLEGSTFQVAAFSTAALSYGRRLPMVPLADFAVGLTLKQTTGHALLLGMDQGSALGGSSVDIDFPFVHPDTTDFSGKVGGGFGVDLGTAWKTAGFRFGVSLQNVINTFKWDSTLLRSGSALGTFSADTSFSKDTLNLPYGAAPVALREKVNDLGFKPVLAAGLSYDWLPKVTLSADIRQQIGEGIEIGPTSTVGAGAEIRFIPFIPLRGGVQMMSGGFGVAGGLGINLFGFETGLAGYVRKRDGGSESGFMFNAISIRP